MFDANTRIREAQEHCAQVGVDVLMVAAGADLLYLSGYEAMPLERLTMLVVPAVGEATLLVPELEAPRVGEVPCQLRAWKETEDPISLVADLIGRPERVAVGDQLWAVFLLALQDKLPHTRFLSATPITRRLRIRKEPAELERLAAAGRAADRVVERLRQERFSGRSERDLARRVVDLTIEEGHDQASFWIVASGPNGASPHHEPGSRIIEERDLVVVDFGGKVGGYGSDCTRTFSVGTPSQEQVEVHAVVLAAQQAAFAAVRAGVAAEAIDRAARDVIGDAGYGEYFIHRTGHGIGLEGHEHPYLVEGNGEPLEPGMCFSIEPGIYLPGRFGVRIEDIVALGEDGPEPLNQADRSLLVVA